MKVVVVTGASSGIGKAIALYLAKNPNYKVVGTSRTPERYTDLGFDVIRLDVRDNQSIIACAEILQQRYQRVDVLINNAGVGITGPMEEIPVEEMRAHFETNFFGPLHLIQQILPMMREQKSGKIINVTSIAGYMGLPYRGIYSASKSAFSTATEALRMEVKNFGVEVCTVAPGDFATNIASGRYHAPVIQGSAYEQIYGQSLATMNAHVDQGEDPIKMAMGIERIIETAQPKVHYKIAAFMQKFSIVLKFILPSKTYERLLMKHYGIN